jgi:AAHS family 4-hydroxybenzoate transporter-like MFS transporter
MVVFSEGYDTFNASYVIHYVMEPWGLRPPQAGLLVSSGMIGFALAALFQGKVSDALGRRVAVIGALWIATIFSMATALWADSFWTFCLWRFLTGVGLGVLLPVSVSYLNEFAPRTSQTRFGTWSWGIGFSAGGVAASAVGVFLTPTHGWQVLYYVASLSAFVAVACHVWLPESPKFLALRGRAADLRQLLAKLDPARAASYADGRTSFVLHERRDHAAALHVLFSSENRRLTLVSWTAAFCVLFAVYGLTSWAPTSMLTRGETLTSSFGFGAVILGMNFFGTLACGAAIDRFGFGRLAPALWWTLGGLAVGVLAFANGHVVNTSAMVLAGFGILGGQGALNNLTATWYDTRIRSTAVGAMLAVGRVGAIAGPYVIGWLQQALGGPNAGFLAIAGAAILGAAIMTIAPPPSSSHMIARNS